MAESTFALLLWLTGVGTFAAIYHPVCIPWLVRSTQRARGKALAFNGIFGSLGGAAAGMIYYSTQTALPKLFESRHEGLAGNGIFGIGLLVACVYTVAAFMQLIGGELADRYPLKIVGIRRDRAGRRCIVAASRRRRYSNCLNSNFSKHPCPANYSGIVVVFQGHCEYFPVRSGENIPVFDSPER
jgi:MFS family permease